MNSSIRQHLPVIKHIALAFLLVLAIAGLTVVVLKVIKPTSTTKKVTQTVEKVVPTPAKIIEQYLSSKNILDRKESYTLQEAKPTNTSISYKKNDSTFQISVTAEKSVEYNRTDKATIENSAGIKSSTEKFLTELGMTKKYNYSVDKSNFIIFDSTATVCQINDVSVFGVANATYGLACIAQSTIKTKYDLINKQLDLYIQAGGTKGGITSVSDTLITEGNKSLLSLSVPKTDKSTNPLTLIFASIDNKWAYIGERTTPSVDVKDSYQLSSKLKLAINDSKYDGFIAKYVK